MQKALHALLAGSMLIGLSPLATATAQEGKVGVNAIIRNEVNQKLAVSGDTSLAEVGGSVFLGDEFVSGDASVAQIILVDETSVTMGPNASLLIDEFVYDTSRDASELAATASRGVFRMFSGRPKRREAKITTPTASIGIRGTLAELAVGNEAAAFARTQGLSFNESEETPTLVILRGPGRGNAGVNKMGELDISNNWGMVTLTKADTAVLVPSLNGEILGPFLITPGGQFELTAAYDQEARNGPSVPVSLPPARPPLDFLPPHGDGRWYEPMDRPSSGCLYIFEGDPIFDQGQQSSQNGNIELCDEVFR